MCERRGVSCFPCGGVGDVSIPDGICESYDQCFKGCWSLRRVRWVPYRRLSEQGRCVSTNESLSSSRYCVLSERLVKPLLTFSGSVI